MVKSTSLISVLILGLVSAQNSDEFTADSLLSQLKPGFKFTDITAHDGIALKSIFFDPSPTSSDGKNPLVIFISSWGMNKWEYVVPANDYAEKGYTVISYTARGFWQSGGVIDMAGSNDMADVSTVIDWAIKNTNTDPNRIGLSGISYGGGISILGSAHDSRVKCVAAMSCWVDLAESFLGNGETIRTEAARALQLLAEVTGKPSDDLEEVFADYFSNTHLEFMYSFTYNSSAVNFLSEINKNKPSVFIANALGDSLFTPNQFHDFFESLDLPKHIEFAPGDHAGPELPGIFGLPNQVWSRAGEWNDFYLLNGNFGQPSPLPLIIFNVMKGDEIEEYESWDEVSNGALTFELKEDENLASISSSYLPSSDGILASILSGENANINGGIPYITSTIRAYPEFPKHFKMWDIKRKYAAVFVSDKLRSSYRLRGVPNLKLSYVPQATNGTLVVYALDVSPLNVGQLITFSPWTFKNALVGKSNVLDIDITLTSYDIPEGHRIGLIVQTHDRLYLDQAPKDTNIDFLSGSILTVPFNSA